VEYLYGGNFGEERIDEDCNWGKGNAKWSPNSKAVIAFTRMQAEAHAKIILHLEPSQLALVCSCNPKVVWDELKTIH
jgi:hypothetical protein